ncbi:zinc finger and BTB domain-containing protein 41-like isoform X3 [Planococcus citri]|uniref:zinc finger and BTB domain-containing protein 41-like isoform X3 n=1 Tax=Planococcus citri TaxID=170843 RepID=UPI0031F97449
MLPSELIGVCRLCLVKDQVEVNIFENDSKDIYYRISTCLPVTIASEDKLPKKICLSCHDKINMFYDFWNQTLTTEKHLLSWLNLDSETSNNICDSSQSYSYCVSESNDADINHSTSIDSDENNADSDLENSVDKRKSNECSEPENNLILNVDYQDDKPGPSGFQVEQTSALKQLQGLGEELIYLYVESEQEEPNDNESASLVDKYCQQPTSNQFSLLFENNQHRHSIIEIEESNADASKSNIEQTSCYSVEFPKNDRSAVELKFGDRKRISKTRTSEIVSYSCEICNISFSDKTDYHKHELIHYVDYPYECSYCGDHFKRFKQLKNHKLHQHTEDLSDGNDSSGPNVTETEENDLYCDDRIEKRSSKVSYVEEPQSSLVKPLPRVLSESCKKYCESGRTLSKESDRKIRSRKRSNEDYYVCETCGQQFSVSNSVHKCSKPKITLM